MKKLAILCLVTALLLTGCGTSNTGSGLVADTSDQNTSTNVPIRQYQIALVMKTLTNPFFVKMEKGARKAEDEFDVDLIVKTGAQETSIAQQIQIVEDLILQKVDVIVIAPGSSVELVNVLKKAQVAGIKIVNIDNRLDVDECEKQGLTGVPFISVRNDEGAYLSAKAIADKVVEPCDALIVEGIRDAENAQLRLAGAKKAFDENKNIRIVASESANWKIDEAYSLAKREFVQHPQIHLVFCANDMMALGVVHYLQEANLKDVLVAGFDNLDEVLPEIQGGWIVATIDQQADLQGYKGIEAAVKLLKGQTVEAETYVPVKVITKAVSQP